MERSGLAVLLRTPDTESRNCVMYHTDIRQDGHFSEVGQFAVDGTEKREALWNSFKVG